MHLKYFHRLCVFFQMVGHNDEKRVFLERSRPHKLFHCIQVMRKSESIATHSAMTSKFPCFTQQWISFKLTAQAAQNMSFHPDENFQRTKLRTIDLDIFRKCLVKHQ